MRAYEFVITSRRPNVQQFYFSLKAGEFFGYCATNGVGYFALFFVVLEQNTIDSAVSALKKAQKELVEKTTSSQLEGVETGAPETEAPATEAPATEGGCGSVIGGAAVVLTAVVALGMGVSLKKKED